MPTLLFPVYKLAPGGAERTASYLASFLAEKGYKVYIVTGYGGEFYKLSSKVRHIVIRKLVYPAEPFNKWAPRIFIRRCWNLMERKVVTPLIYRLISPDVVFGLMASSCSPYLNHKHRGRIKVISSERSNPICEGEDALKLRSGIFEQCDGVVFQTERASLCYSEEIRAKSVIIPNAVGNEDVYHVEIPTKRKKLICAIGRLSDEKNYPLLLNAFRNFRESHPDHKLVIYGEGVKREELINLTEKLGIEKWVSFAGTDTHAILKCVDAACYVLASNHEGMPNSLMEAMAAGIPSISTDCPFGPAELIKNEENGLLVPVGDVDALGEAMARMVDDEELAMRCSENGRKLLETNSVERQCELYEKFILHVLGEE